MNMENRLKLEYCEGQKYMKALRLLANLYKHDPSMLPNKELLELLKIETGINFAPLPESDSLREGLAAFIGLWKSATYCDIAERFVEIASDFLVTLQSRTKLSRVKQRVSLHPRDFAH